MSTKTEKFDLHQWAPTDNFSRSEINENFQKLDLSAAKVVAGSFTGTGTAGQHITLGFKPKLLILFGPYRSGTNDIYHAMSFTTEEFALRNVDGNNKLYSTASEYITLTDDGFTVSRADSIPKDYTKYYIALY